MQIEHLEECIDLSTTLNFTQTAKRFYITQPVLSKHVSNIEQELGIKIFHRDQHRVRVTVEGEIFIDGAMKTVADHQETLSKIRKYQEGISETMSVGFLLGAIRPFIPAAHSGFSRQYPCIEIKYSTCEFAEIYKALYSNKVDVAIAGITEQLSEERLNIEPLFKEQFCIVMSANHRLSDYATINPADLCGETVVLPAESFWPSFASKMKAYLDPTGGDIVFHEDIQDINTLPLLLDTENCVGVAMGHLRRYYGESRVFIPLANCPIGFQVAAVWKKGNSKNTYIRDYIEQIRRAIRENSENCNIMMV